MAITLRSALINTNSSATNSVITLSATSSTTVLSANSSRIRAVFSNTGSGAQRIWLKLQAASVDDDKKGHCIEVGANFTIEAPNIYTGEISAIAVVDSPPLGIVAY